MTAQKFIIIKPVNFCIYGIINFYFKNVKLFLKLLKFIKHRKLKNLKKTLLHKI